MGSRVLPSRCLPIVLGMLAAATLATDAARAIDVEVLTPVFALPALAINQLQEPTHFVTSSTGEYFVLDRRAHTVVTFDAQGRQPRPLLQIGYEPGRILQPASIAMSRDDILAVLDAPNTLQRIQYFTTAGSLIGGFFLPIQGTPHLVINGQVVAGTGAMAFTGKTFLVNEPNWGSLVAELDTTGKVIRQVGALRPTGQEADAGVHLALNAGLPVVDPTGGFFFIFQTGIPAFRKYSADGRLQYERHIEGAELDSAIQALPTTWKRRETGTYPLPPTLIRTATADRDGRLWVSLTAPFTYVYGPAGEKLRVVQFRGASITAASSLFFKPDGRLLTGPGGYEFTGR